SEPTALIATHASHQAFRTTWLPASTSPSGGPPCHPGRLSMRPRGFLRCRPDPQGCPGSDRKSLLKGRTRAFRYFFFKLSACPVTPEKPRRNEADIKPYTPPHGTVTLTLGALTRGVMCGHGFPTRTIRRCG